MEGSRGKLYINIRSETWELFEIFGGYWGNFQTFQSLILGVNLLSCKIGCDIVIRNTCLILSYYIRK